MFDIELLKGIHPAKIISRELEKLQISQREFARMLNMHSQSLNAILKGRRNLTVESALKIEKALNLPEASLLVLQIYHTVKNHKTTFEPSPQRSLPNIRPVIFWDTDFTKLDWNKQKRFIIKRVRERGNEKEKEETALFYNIDTL